jgi:hypothetical protein
MGDMAMFPNYHFVNIPVPPEHTLSVELQEKNDSDFCTVSAIKEATAEAAHSAHLRVDFANTVAPVQPESRTATGLAKETAQTTRARILKAKTMDQ